MTFVPKQIEKNCFKACDKQTIDNGLCDCNNRIGVLKTYIKDSPDSDPRDAYEIKHWNEEISVLKQNIMTEKNIDKCTKLYVWDFDGTLCNTPLPEVGKPIWKEATGKDWEHVGWWSKVESLDLNVFEHPTLPSVMSDFDKVKYDSDVINIMLTGRRANKALEDAVKAILDSHGLKFDMYFHNNGGETGDNKMWRIEKLLSEFPNIESIAMWDDRDEHIPRFQEWGDKLISEGKIKEFKITHVIGEHHGLTP